jgi:predicted TIM-barrel fold metal-dependent hydrolase
LVAQVFSATTGSVCQYFAERQMLFGTDFPLITPERWIKDFDEAGFKEQVKPLILKENAIKMLKLKELRIANE